jgi:peptide deformylase
MSVHPIIQAPNPALLEPSFPVNRLRDAINDLMGDLIVTRLENDCAGLSAVQIGPHLRIVAVSPKLFYGFKILVNPQIVARSERMVTDHEGCMSIRHGVPRFQVSRHEFVQVHFMDRTGQMHDLRAEGFAARLIQHEIDHLDGKLIA